MLSRTTPARQSVASRAHRLKLVEPGVEAFGRVTAERRLLALGSRVHSAPDGY